MAHAPGDHTLLLKKDRQLELFSWFYREFDRILCPYSAGIRAFWGYLTIVFGYILSGGEASTAGKGRLLLDTIDKDERRP
ncbi:MAG: hypothetical protein LBC51_04505 [Treponema sp.]|jgi:hypothetical protein|nr:hypothetical protein [Treponema sp.]